MTTEAKARPAEKEFTITLERIEGYRFNAGFDVPGMPPIEIDESPPIGEGRGPSPARMLATAVGHCLASSALFCLEKAHVPVDGMTVRVNGAIGRSESGRLRVTGLDVVIEPHVAEEDIPRMRRCLEVFEDYCTVSGSVRQGVPIGVTVEPAA
jgi:uncharacterized OsmC-like protein